MLRKLFKERRASLSPLKRQEAADKVAQLFSSHLFFQQSKTIALYWPTPVEMNTQPILDMIWQAKKRCFLPILTDAQALQFVEYQKDAPLKQNRYKIFEPVNVSSIASLAELDLIVLPLIAFDERGYRLGTGGGYYDRTLQSINALSHPPILLGLAYAIQKAEQLPHDSWDIRMNGVITEDGITIF